MKVTFRTSFARDLKKLNDRQLRRRVRAMIEVVEAAPELSDVPSVKAISGHPGFFRIRVGDYRVGITNAGNNVDFVRCLARRDFYRYFP